MTVNKPQQDARPTDAPSVHLLVLVHGLWGDPVHLTRVVEGIQKAYPPSSTPLRVLVPKTNAGSFTYDGIDVGGERVVSEIHEHIEALANPSSDATSTTKSSSSSSSYSSSSTASSTSAPSVETAKQLTTQSPTQASTPERVTKISFLGYSLGGLVARYAIGLLSSTGFFDAVEPVNFTTFATPHLGVRTPSTGFVYSAFNALGSLTLCTSGRQLFTIDTFRDTGRCLLDVMADPASIFVRGLSRFPRRAVYANIINDRAVPYYTAAISFTDPFVDLDAVTLNAAPGYDDVILDSARPAAPREGGPAGFYEAVSNTASRAWARAPFVAALGLAAPIAVTAYLVNAGWQTYSSTARLKLHREGKLGVQQPERWQLPVMVEKLNQGAEQAMEMAQAAGGEHFLAEHDDNDNDDDDSSKEINKRRKRRSNGGNNGQGNADAADAAAARRQEAKEGEALSQLARAKDEADDEPAPENDGPFPTLALTPAQFRMIRHLNALGFDKFPVHVRRATHSHAAIVVRMERASFEDGRVAIRHWTERFAV